jgi:glycosyltransferase involved in cell wall biosynthesis
MDKLVTLSLSMIVKNEAKYLKDCLESVKTIVDEIIIVDTGSDDNTIDIAKSYDAKIFPFEWINDFSAARNYALTKSTGKWILYLDADERLNPDSIKEIRNIVQSGSKIGIWCKVISIDEKNNRPNMMKYIRLFKNSPNLKFSGKAHEQILPSLVANAYTIKDSAIEISHLGYNVDKNELDKKATRNLELLLSEYKEVPNSYTAFQIAQSYAIIKEEFEARKYFEIALKDKNLSGEYKTISYRYIAGQEYNRNNLDKAKELIDKGLSLGFHQPLLYMVASQIYFKIGDKERAELLCMQGYEYNSKLVKGELESAFDLLVAPDIIAYYGIDYAIKNRNKTSFNFYFKELKSMKRIHGDSEVELEFIYSLFNNHEFSVDDINRFSSIVNQKNLELFLSLLENYKQNKSKYELLRELKGRFSESIRLFNIIGNTMIALGRNKEAKELWESRIVDNSYDPSTILYLVSIYINENETEKIAFLLNTGLTKFKENPAVVKILNGVKQRVVI